jgi:hypothetical protein
VEKSCVEGREVKWFKEGFLKKNEKKLVRSFNFMFHYIDDIISINNSKLGDFGDRIYPIEFEIKDIRREEEHSLYP